MSSMAEGTTNNDRNFLRISVWGDRAGSYGARERTLTNCDITMSWDGEHSYFKEYSN